VHRGENGAMNTSPVISLLTDFGLKDGYVGTMHGVIYRICPQAKIVDLSHGIAPQDTRAGAFLLAAHARYFPSGTVHVAAVDPGVGSERRILLARDAAYFYLAPDNGLLSFLEEKTGVKFYFANNPDYWLPDLSNTFHGRDIFAPLAAHLANGVAIETMFAPATDMVRLPAVRPQIRSNGIRGRIVYVDHFGNLVTNIAARDLPGEVQDWHAWAGDRDLGPLVAHYSEKKKGKLLATVGSFGFIEIAVNLGSAAEVLPGYPDLEVKLLPHRNATR